MLQFSSQRFLFPFSIFILLFFIFYFPVSRVTLAFLQKESIGPKLFTASRPTAIGQERRRRVFFCRFFILAFSLFPFHLFATLLKFAFLNSAFFKYSFISRRMDFAFIEQNYVQKAYEDLKCRSNSSTSEIDEEREKKQKLPCVINFLKTIPSNSLILDIGWPITKWGNNSFISI